MNVRRHLLRALLVLWLAGCSSPPDPNATPTPRPPFTIENTGAICFYVYNADPGTLEGAFYPKGCYSSTCTEILEQNATVTVDEQARRILIESRFVLRDTTVLFPEARSCTADCMGGGAVRFVLERVTGTIYEVILGAESLGVLDIEQVNTKHPCLGQFY